MPTNTIDTVNACEASVKDPVNDPNKMRWQNANVRAVHNYDGTPPVSWRVHDVTGNHFFPAAEWEMTVEFKRKPKVLAVGDRVNAWRFIGIIEAISETTGRKEYWVRNTTTGVHSTYFEGEIQRDDD